MYQNSELYFQTDDIQLFLGDARHLSAIDDESVHFVVTSPPYWDIKSYKASKQVGLGQSYPEYLKEIEISVRECHRVLKAGRFFAVVIGTRVSDGELKHIPSDLITLCADIGLGLRKEIIWAKPKGTQGLWQRGTTQFLKSKPHANCMNINIVHEFILIFQKEGAEPPVDTSYVIPEDFIKEVAWSVWPLPVSRTKGHPAPFPVEIPKRLITLYTTPGETVLDPFVGTGSTLLAAHALGRYSIGVEISTQYCELVVEKVKSGTQMPLSL